MSDYIDLTHLRSVDNIPIRGVTIELLDAEKTAVHIKQASERRRWRGTTDVHEFWHTTGCTAKDSDEECATIAGIMAFGRDPQLVFPNSVITLVHYHGDVAHSNEVFARERIGGTIFEQAARLEKYIEDHNPTGQQLMPGSFQRVDIQQWPFAAVREATINAIAHRDYTDRLATSDFLMFRSWMSVSNPGGLLPGMTVGMLEQVHKSRNPVIAELLRQAGLSEEAGQGIDTIIQEYARAGLPRPLFEDLNGAFFRVTLQGRAFEVFARTGVYAQLSDRQRHILIILRGAADPLSSVQITERLNAEGDPVQARQVLRDINGPEGLIELGLVDQRGKSHATRYQLSTIVQHHLF
jgi:ATP-dependent DNA helicase RecG